MNPARLVPGLVLLAALAGCSGLSVSTDFDPEAPLDTYQAWAWKNQSAPGGRRLIANEMAERTIRRVVEREMEAKGYVKRIKPRPDFVVAIYFGIERKVDVTHDYGHWRGRGRPPVAEVHHYREGTLVIDVIEWKSDELVWRGVAEGALGPRGSAEGRVDEAVVKLLEKFPPVQATAR